MVDGFAGLWCVNAGYGQDNIVEAATRQLRELPYATGYFGLGSEPAIRLAARLAELAPGDLNHVYFTLGGSDAVDSTVRFIRYYYHAKGTPQKDQFISRGAGLSWIVDRGRRLDGAARLPCRVWRAAIAGSTRSRRTMPIAILSDRITEAIIAASVAALRAKIARTRRGSRRRILCRADPGIGRRARAAAGLG